MNPILQRNGRMNRTLQAVAFAIAILGAAILPAVSQAAPPNLSGDKWWNPEEQHSRWSRMDFEGRWMANNRNGFESRGFRGLALLPNTLRIDQGRRVVRIADARYNVVQVIALQNHARGWRHDGTVLTGTLYGSRLVARGEVGRGRDLTQIMTLRNGGRTLVVRTRVERGRSGRVVEYEQTYHRA